jgi:galactonate dehydratase
MKISAVETIRLPDRPNLLLVQVHTDAGFTGLGETSRGALAVEAQIHDIVAPYLIAVGMLVTEHPPHRTERARFRHSAPTLGE